MRPKSEKLKRLVVVQRHLEHIALRELAEVTRQRQQLHETLEAVVEAIGSIDSVHPLFSGIYANQISRLTIKDHQLTALERAQEQRILRERAKADRLTEWMAQARLGEDREQADKEGLDLIDLLFLKPAASLRGDG